MESTCIEFSKDIKSIYCASTSGKLAQLNIINGDIQTIISKNTPIRNIEISPCGKLMYYINFFEKCLQTIDIENNEEFGQEKSLFNVPDNYSKIYLDQHTNGIIIQDSKEFGYYDMDQYKLVKRYDILDGNMILFSNKSKILTISDYLGNFYQYRLKC